MKNYGVIIFMAYFTCAMCQGFFETKGREIVETCLTSLDMTKEDLENYKKTMSPDKNFKCFIECFAKEAGILKDGEVQDDVALEIMSKCTKFEYNADKAKDVIAKCKVETGEDDCDKAFNMYKCFKTNMMP